MHSTRPTRVEAPVLARQAHSPRRARDAATRDMAARAETHAPRATAPVLHVSAWALARSWDRDRDRAPIARREAPRIEIWWCAGPCGGGFTDRGSFAAGVCTRCGTPDPRRSNSPHTL